MVLKILKLQVASIKSEDKMYDIAIIGGGPAGMTAGLYAARAGLKAVIFEEKFFGGQIINSHKVDNYPALPGISGYDLADRLISQLREFEIDIKNKKIVSCSLFGDEKIISTKKEEFRAKSVIIATGAKPRKLGVENEDKLTGLGVSYCATCDGAFYKDKAVAVVGGGNTALDDALYLANFTKKVYLIHRRDSFRGSETTLAKIKANSKIEIIKNNEIEKINGNEKLESITLKDGLSLQVDGLFIAVGNEPVTELFKDQVALDEKGYVIVDENLKTNLNLVYGAGDVITKKLRQVVTAQSDGAVALSNILEEL